MSFNAYEHYGAMEAAAAVAKTAARTSIEECRAELFFKARAARHTGSDSYITAYADLLPFIERFTRGDK